MSSETTKIPFGKYALAFGLGFAAIVMYSAYSEENLEKLYVREQPELTPAQMRRQAIMKAIMEQETKSKRAE